MGAGDNIKEFSDVDWGKFTAFLEARGRAESALFNGKVPYTIIRTGGIVMDAEAPATGMGKLVEDQTHFGDITRRDLSTLVVGCVVNAACLSKVFHSTDPTLESPAETGR